MNKPAQSVVREEPARFSVTEFSSIAEAVALADFPDRFELIDGVIARMPPAHMPHVRVANDLCYAIRRALEAGSSELSAYTDVGLSLDADTLRQPDVLVFHRRDGEAYANAADVLLAVEVADSTLALDLGPRKLRFARASVPHYWVIDVEGARVHLFADPRDGDYTRHEEQPLEAELPVPGTDRRIGLHR